MYANVHAPTHAQHPDCALRCQLLLMFVRVCARCAWHYLRAEYDLCRDYIIFLVGFVGAYSKFVESWPREALIFSPIADVLSLFTWLANDEHIHTYMHTRSTLAQATLLKNTLTRLVLKNSLGECFIYPETLLNRCHSVVYVPSVYSSGRGFVRVTHFAKYNMRQSSM